MLNSHRKTARRVFRHLIHSYQIQSELTFLFKGKVLSQMTTLVIAT